MHIDMHVINPGSVPCRPFKCQPFLSCLSDYIEHLIFKKKKQNIHTKPYIFMKLTCLAFQKKIIWMSRSLMEGHVT